MAACVFFALHPQLWDHPAASFVGDAWPLLLLLLVLAGPLV